MDQKQYSRIRGPSIFFLALSFISLLGCESSLKAKYCVIKDAPQFLSLGGASVANPCWKLEVDSPHSKAVYLLIEDVQDIEKILPFLKELERENGRADLLNSRIPKQLYASSNSSFKFSKNDSYWIGNIDAKNSKLQYAVHAAFKPEFKMAYLEYAWNQ